MNHPKPDFDYERLEKELQSAADSNMLFDAIVNSPFKLDRVATALIFLGIIVLLLVNKKDGTIDRIALTDNEFAEATLTVSAKKFEEIKIPLKAKQNIIAKAIEKQIPTKTTDWRYLFEPELTQEQARINQASAGIAYSSVYPLIGVKDGAALIFSFYQYPENFGDSQVEFMETYSSAIAKALRARL